MTQQRGEFGSFEDFVMTSARGMLNEADLAQVGEGPIPDNFVLAENPVWTKELEKAKVRLEQLKKMNGAEFLAMEQNVVSFDAAKKQANKAHAESLLAQLEQWVPPTNEHVDFKESMHRLLSNRVQEFSLESKTAKAQLSGEEYLKRAIGQQELYIARLEGKVQSERNRVQMINNWFADLRQSLKRESAITLTA